jgi:catechol 2,3-dioxygenase-like lactoylglutathione lyase family enzyme
MAFRIDSLDHLVLTVSDLEATCAFYRDVLGMEVVTFGGGRKALKFGRQKFNLHQLGADIQPKAKAPTPGAIDLCLLTATPLAEVMTHLTQCGVSVEMGPIDRTGANGPIRSVYIRDPDANLVEIANPC